MNKKVYLQGDGTIETGKKIIDYLESLGGINLQRLSGYGGAVAGRFVYYIYSITNSIVYDVPPDDYEYLDVNLIPHKKVYFKAIPGNIEYNLRIIRYLESIGGNAKQYNGNPESKGYYYINDSDFITYLTTYFDKAHLLKDYILGNIDDYTSIKGDLDRSSEECFKEIIENMKKNGVKVIV
jgi:hypothetical protein